MVTKEKELAWKPARAGALARIIGVHTHPTIPGLVIRTTVKKAVYGWHFRDGSKEATMQNGTYGRVAEAGGEGITLEKVLRVHNKKYLAAKSEAGTLTLSNAFTEWNEKSTKKGGGDKSAITQKGYQECYTRYLEDEAGEWLLEDVTPVRWQAVLDKAKKKSPHQTRTTYWMLSSIYKYFIERDALLINPMAKGFLRKAFSGDDTKHARTSQVPAIDLGLFVAGVGSLTSRNKQPRRAILYTMLSGWRKGAVLAMRWDHFDFSKGIYTVPPKARGWKAFAGEMAVNAYMMSVLQERIAEGGQAESEFVFPARHGKSGHMVDIRGSMDIVCRQLGYRIVPHDLRRTFATVGDVVLDSNILLLGRLMAHATPIQEPTPGSYTTKKYIIRNLQAERVSGTKVAEAILELAGSFPLSDEVAAKFEERGIDIKQRLALVEMQDDDEA